MIVRRVTDKGLIRRKVLFLADSYSPAKAVDGDLVFRVDLINNNWRTCGKPYMPEVFLNPVITGKPDNYSVTVLHKRRVSVFTLEDIKTLEEAEALRILLVMNHWSMKVTNSSVYPLLKHIPIEVNELESDVLAMVIEDWGYNIII